MKTKILLFLVFIGFALILPGHASSQGRNPEVLKAVQKLKEKMGNKIKAEWHRDGRIKTLDGKLSLPYSGDPKDAAKQFLKDNAAIFQMAPDIRDLEVEYSKETYKGYHHIRFKQTFKSLPIFNGGVEAHIDKDNSVFLIHNYYLPNINIPTSPTLTEKEVIEIAKNDYIKHCRYRRGKTEEYRSCEDAAILFRENPYIQIGLLEYQSKPYLVYMVNLATESPTYDSVLYMIDANIGTVMEKKRLVQEAGGTGKAFDPNPINTFNNTGLQDNRDRDNSIFNSAYFTRSLNYVTFDNSSYYLYGPHVDVTDAIEKPYYFNRTSGYVLSTSGDFNFTRQPNEFEHVMTYYHIDTNQRYVQSLGFANINNRRIRVDPHGLSGADDSYYKVVYPDYPPGAGYLAFGEGGVDDAEDADIILHEYGHSIQDNQTNGKYLYSGETGAMGEGFGDYWAASNTYDISIANGFDPACVGEWDAAPNCLRRVDSTKHYPEDIVGEVHADGEIWSGALWDMFKSLGKTTTDMLVLWSHTLVPDKPTFCSGAKAILQADEQLYSGTYKTIISDTMINRGIDVNVSEMIISGPDAPVDGDQYIVAGGLPPYTWSISKGSITQDGIVTVSGQCGTATITVTDACGTASKDVRMPSGAWFQTDIILPCAAGWIGGSCVDRTVCIIGAKKYITEWSCSGIWWSPNYWCDSNGCPLAGTDRCGNIPSCSSFSCYDFVGSYCKTDEAVVEWMCP